MSALPSSIVCCVQILRTKSDGATLRLRPRQSQLLHLNRELQDIIDTLALRLRLVHIIAPHISASRQQLFLAQSTAQYSHAVPSDQYRIAVRILLHGRL